MGEWFEKGGKISGSTTYVPNRSIKELSITLGKSLKKLKGTDIVDGVYVKNDALNTTKRTSMNSVNDIFDDIVSMANLKGLESDVKFIKKDDIQKLLDAGYDREDLMAIYFGPTSLTNVNIDNQIDLGLLGLSEDFIQSGIEKLLEAAKNKTYELGLKYPDFNWSDILSKYKIDKSGKDVNGKERTSKNSPADKTFYVYRIFEGDKVVVGTSIDRVRIINGKKDDDDYYRKDPNDLKNFKGGYWGIVSSDKKIIKDIAKMILRKKSGYVKNIDIFVNNLGGVDSETLDLNKIPYELGGEVMVQPTILQNNPDYITSTATMGEWFEKGGSVSKSWKPINSVYYDSSDYNYPYTLVIGNLAWGISDEFNEPVFRGNIQEQFFMSTWDFAQKSGVMMSDHELPQSVAKKVKEIRSKDFDTLRGKRYPINPSDYPAFFEKGGRVDEKEFFESAKRESREMKIERLMSEKAYERSFLEKMPDSKLMALYDSEFFYEDERFEKGGKIGFEGLARKVAKRYEGKPVPSDYQSEYGKTYSKDEAMEVGRKVAAKVYRQQQAKMAKGGALYHRLMPGDEVLKIYKDYLIIENDEDFIYVIDFRPEVAKRIQVEEIEGENTIEAAKRVADRDFEYAKYAMGGSLEVHGLEEGDLIVEDEGAYINVLSEDGKIFYIDLARGERSTEPPLPFEHGGEVKIGDIARLAAKYNKTGQEVAAAISEGADVEVEHTEDRKRAMRIAVDHLDEDFYYYPKLKAAEGQPDFSDFYEKGGQVPEQFLDSNGERKIDAKSIEELTDYVMALPQTKSIYFNEATQEYVPSRRKLHADIINKFKEEVVCITEGQPIAIFMGGSPASGKSSFLRKYSPYLLKEEILKVDADEIRAMLPEYDGYNAAQTHLETKDIVNTLLSNKNIGIPCDFDLIYDGTMNSVKSYIPLMDILRKRGYKIFIVYMDKVPKDVIIKRALERYKKSGRFVPLEVIEDFFEKGKTAFNDLKKEVDGYMVIDGSNQDYEIIEQGGIKLPTNREYSKLGSKIDPKDIPALYKKGGKTKNG
jgi:predicted ABC-type ATPase